MQRRDYFRLFRQRIRRLFSRWKLAWSVALAPVTVDHMNSSSCATGGSTRGCWEVASIAAVCGVGACGIIPCGALMQAAACPHRRCLRRPSITAPRGALGCWRGAGARRVMAPETRRGVRRPGGPGNRRVAFEWLARTPRHSQRACAPGAERGIGVRISALQRTVAVATPLSRSWCSSSRSLSCWSGARVERCRHPRRPPRPARRRRVLRRQRCRPPLVFRPRRRLRRC